MAFSTDSKGTFALGLAATTASALMLYFGNGMEPVWPLMWFALTPMLWFALRSSWQAAAIASAATMLLGGVNLWNYFHTTLGAPAWVWFANFSLMALVLLAGTLLLRTLVRRGAVISGLLALPSLWVASEYLRNVATPHGSAGSLAYSQLRFLPFLQLASITGPWGMTFVLLLLSASLAIALHLYTASRSQAVTAACVGIGVAAAALLFGAVRMQLPQGQQVRVGLVASDVSVKEGGLSPTPVRQPKSCSPTMQRWPQTSRRREHVRS